MLWTPLLHERRYGGTNGNLKIRRRQGQSFTFCYHQNVVQDRQRGPEPMNGLTRRRPSRRLSLETVTFMVQFLIVHRSKSMETTLYLLRINIIRMGTSQPKRRSGEERERLTSVITRLMNLLITCGQRYPHVVWYYS